MSLDRMAKWIFPIKDEDGMELAYADVIKPRRRGAPAHYIIGAAGGLRISERDIPLLKGFLDALEQAPRGTRIINCPECGCTTVEVDGQLMGTDNSGTECDEHECTHTHGWIQETKEGGGDDRYQRPIDTDRAR